MNDLIQFILNGSEDAFTPTAIIGFIVFIIIFDGLCALVGAVLGGVHK